MLLDQRPLVLLPTLAAMVGTDAAIILQQLHYYLADPDSGKEHDGERWIFNTYEGWQEHDFPHLSTKQIQRIFLRLEKRGLVASCQPEGRKNRKKYYRIDYHRLDELLEAGGQLVALASSVRRPPQAPRVLPMEQIETLRRQVNETITSSGMSPAAVDDWEQTVREHGRATRYRPPAIHLDELYGDFAELGHQLKNRHSSFTLRRLTRVTAQLAGKRLNASGTVEETAARWAAECVVSRLAPAGDPVEAASTLPDASGAAPPPPTPATRRTRNPFRLHRVRRPR